ncbi:hypothetical protein BO70DRAFT_362973 [Aspergillus heteromorphus CBS 117.55]|uniref:J domain-containing protein n=1 Tax=Aspergillus heteromorphus CBS 117.55 TaxID=1448321 RepID=A0A317W0T5_9EURO|nr:uncharacterized protein BO70DRAFT_362973 [Aspergillus heteromorphus CBS 117.55]PWY79211.1 hypothetical protein BO70DRAFT_362973 [Aspergillus heteromorphus CBS 117.55]
MPRKPNILYRGGLQLLSSPCPPPHRYSYIARPYATGSDNPAADISWPSSPTFTPYELFQQDRRAAYSKSRYYEMVKVYHPDRPCNGHPLCRDLSPEVRLQRYRIIVAAHEILSDPSRRSDYDRFGLGWNLHPSTAQSAGAYDPIFSNATWEDWERWHNRHQRKPETLVDHRTFATFVILLTLLGGALQASWITQLHNGYESRVSEFTEESARLLKGRKDNTVHQMRSLDARVEHFLIRRDPSGCGLKEGEQPVYEKVLHSRKGSGASAKAEGAGNQKAPDNDSGEADGGGP